MGNELINKLFTFKRTVVYNDVTLYIRIPGDQVVEDIRNDSLLVSRKLRRALRDPATDEYLMHIDIVEDIDLEDLRQACASLAVRDVMRDYVNNNPRPVIEPLGDNPSQEEQENSAAAKLQREIDYTLGLRDYVEDWTKRYSESMAKATPEQVKSVYKRLKVDRVCEEAFTAHFEDSIVQASVFTDSDYTAAAFTLEEFKGLPAELKKFLKDEFTSLNLSGDDLKK